MSSVGPSFQIQAMPRAFCLRLCFTSMAPTWWFLSYFSIENNNDKSESFFFFSLGYVFHWKVGNHLKVLFLIGPGVFLASLTWFFFPVTVPDSTPGVFSYLCFFFTSLFLTSLLLGGCHIQQEASGFQKEQRCWEVSSYLPSTLPGVGGTGNSTVNQFAQANYLRKSSAQDLYPVI